MGSLAAPTFLDRLALQLSPEWGLRRMRHRAAAEIFARHYEAASTGRRTDNWRRSSGDANAVAAGSISRLREHARDLVRNNPYANSAVSTIADHTVGWGIVAKPKKKNPRALEAWTEWAESTQCDADGRLDFYGLQKQVIRTVVEGGEILVRRRLRRPEDGLPIPLQIQLLEGDYIDTNKNGTLRDGGEIVSGIEFDALGRRRAYWLFPEHPGASGAVSSFTARRVDARSILHVYRQTRPGQVRGVSWLAAVILRLKDFDEYEDAQLMKQKIAACLTVLTTDVDGAPTTLGEASTSDATLDQLGPGLIGNIAPGRDVEIVNPPRVGEYRDFAEVTLRSIATGIGVTYEDLTGDYTNLPFSAARMSRLRHFARVHDWRWQMLIPQFCDPVFAWAMQMAIISGRVRTDAPVARWTAPPPAMIEPDKEGLAYQRNIRAGLMTLSEAIRERGYDPDELLAEYKKDLEKLDDLGVVLDVDARNMTQAGQWQSKPEPKPADPKPEPEPADPPPPPPPVNGKAPPAETK